jgi:hypothetical protein
MEKVLVASIRGVICLAVFAALAACNDGNGSSGSSIPTAEGPSFPSTHPSTPPNPPGVEEPAQPAEPSQPEVPAEDSDAAPQIMGAPNHQAVVGQTFTFTPSASDADGDALSFVISGKPSWASFDARTGRLSGIPAAGDVGSHEGIQITVSDGEHFAALAAFALDVVQQTNGSATLSWTPPTENTDGSALTNLKGYRIHYGMAPGEYDQSVTVDNGGVTSHMIENLPPGTWYFAVSSLSMTGTESSLSGEVSKTI